MESICAECGCQMLAYETSCPVCGNIAAIESEDEMTFGEDYGELDLNGTQVLDELYLE